MLDNHVAEHFARRRCTYTGLVRDDFGGFASQRCASGQVDALGSVRRGQRDLPTLIVTSIVGIDACAHRARRAFGRTTRARRARARVDDFSPTRTPIRPSVGARQSDFYFVRDKAQLISCRWRRDAVARGTARWSLR